MSEPRKAALVTGSATGIGRAVALRFAKEGLAVAVNYSRSEADAHETLAAVQRFGVPALLCRAPVQEEQAVRAMVAAWRLGRRGLVSGVTAASMGARHRTEAGISLETVQNLGGLTLLGGTASGPSARRWHGRRPGLLQPWT